MKSKAIAILGMHRSGTSLAARGINLLGAYLGEEADIMGPAADNPAGFWERWDLMDFHDRVLQSLGRTWDDPSPMPDLESHPMAPGFVEELTLKLDALFMEKCLWAFKDPRACLLLPMWKKALARLNTSLGAVIVVRNPEDVAASLKVRNGFSHQKSLALWKLHYGQVLRNIEDTPLAMVNFKNLTINPEHGFKKIVSAMNLPAGPDAVKAAASSIQPDLIHHESLDNSGLAKHIAPLIQALAESSGI